jgi:hypothetical protein
MQAFALQSDSWQRHQSGVKDLPAEMLAQLRTCERTVRTYDAANHDLQALLDSICDEAAVNGDKVPAKGNFKGRTCKGAWLDMSPGSMVRCSQLMIPTSPLLSCQRRRHYDWLQPTKEVADLRTQVVRLNVWWCRCK